MKTIFGRLAAAAAALVLATGLAAAQSKPSVKIAIGGAGCLCYLPTVLAKHLGEYDKAGVDVEMIDFKGGSQALQAVLGGSADMVSGYYDHCVNLAAKGQSLQSFVAYNRYPRAGPRRLAGGGNGHQVDQGSGGQERRRLGAGLLDRLLPEVPAREERRGRQLAECRGRRPCGDRGCRHGARQGARRRDARSRGDAAAEQVQGSQVPQRHAHAEGHAGRVRRRISGRLALHPRRLDRQERGHHTAARDRDRRDLAVDSREQAGRRHGEDAGRAGWARQGALSRGTEEHDPDVSRPTGKMDPKGAQAVLAVFSQSVPDIAKANIDLSKTYTNKYVEQARKSSA